MSGGRSERTSTGSVQSLLTVADNADRAKDWEWSIHTDRCTIAFTSDDESTVATHQGEQDEDAANERK